MWESVARVNWRPFEEAREFVRSLELGHKDDWADYCRSGKRPADIPSAPGAVYANKGWDGWSDWLANDRLRPGGSRPFKEARAFVRSLDLKSVSAWRDYCRSGEKPNDVPVTPECVYAKDGWDGWSDWLASGGPRRKNWRAFKEARAFIHKLRLTRAGDWREYCRSGKRPIDIPSNPERVYADTGWSGWSDWLGNGNVRPNWRPFERARAFARQLGFNSESDWREYCRSGKKPDDIPQGPHNVYLNIGWSGWSDWLGNGGTRRGGCLPFKQARAFARKLGLKSQTEWREYCRSGKKPIDIPAKPDAVYGSEGWGGLSDWLGKTA
jgi:hypothetical protein